MAENTQGMRVCMEVTIRYMHGGHDHVYMKNEKWVHLGAGVAGGVQAPY